MHRLQLTSQRAILPFLNVFVWTWLDLCVFDDNKMHTFENALVCSVLPSSSESKGPFMAGKAKNMPQKCTFLGGRGKWSEGHGPTLGGAKFFETSFPHFKTYFIQIGCCHPYLIKRLIPIITLSSTFSFQNAWPIKRKAVYTLVLFHIFIKILFNF